MKCEHNSFSAKVAASRQVVDGELTSVDVIVSLSCNNCKKLFTLGPHPFQQHPSHTYLLSATEERDYLDNATTTTPSSFYE